MRILAISRPTALATPSALSETMSEEIEVGRRLYRDGVIVQAYMDPSYQRAFMIIEAPSVEVAIEKFAAYPQVAKGLIEFDYTALIGLPAVAQVHQQDGTPLPVWWPGAAS